MFRSSSKATTTTNDNDQIVAPGGVLITADSSGQILADFSDPASITAAREATGGAIASANNLTNVALQLAERSTDATDVIKLAIVAGALLGMTYFLVRARNV